MTPRALTSSVMCALVLFSCAPDPKVVAERTAIDIQALLREAWITAEETNGWASLDSSLVAMGLSPQSRSSSVRVPAVTSLDSTVDSLKKRVNRVFVESNIVDRSGGALTFQVRGVDLCANDNGAIDPPCADAIDRQRLAIKAYGDLDLALLVGPNKDEALVLEVRKGVSLAVVVDLEKAMAAANSFQAAQAGMSITYNVKARGKVEARLTKHGKGDFTASTAVLVPVTWDMTGNDGVTRTANIAARNPVASFRLEAPAKRATLQYGLGEVRYSGILRDLFGSEPTTRPLDVFLSGAGLTFVFEDGKAPRLEGVGLGSTTSTVKSGNEVLFSADFNKDHGRAVAATWEQTARGFKLNFTPGLQLNARVNLASLASPTYRVAPEHQNATYSASFLAPGKSPSVEFFTNRSSSGSSFARILEGELMFSVDDSRVAPRRFSAPTCLGSSSSGALTNTYVENFVSVPCP